MTFLKEPHVVKNYYFRLTGYLITPSSQVPERTSPSSGGIDNIIPG